LSLLNSRSSLSPAFWDYRINQSTIPIRETRIPDYPSQLFFLQYWYSFYLGFSLLYGYPLTGEPWRDVDPGRLPRTADEIRDGLHRSQFEELIAAMADNADPNDDPPIDSDVEIGWDELISAAERETAEESTTAPPAAENPQAAETPQVAENADTSVSSATASTTRTEEQPIASETLLLRRSFTSLQSLAEYMNVLRSEVDSLRVEANLDFRLGRQSNNRLRNPMSLDSGNRPEPKKDEDMKVDLQCKVCFHQVANIACLPCGHLSMCEWYVSYTKSLLLKCHEIT
jgi:hypothetical protein